MSFAILRKSPVPGNLKYLQETQMIGALLGWLMHAIFIVLFAVFHINILLWFNILVSLPAFTIAFILSYNGKLKIPPFIGTIETSVHQIIAVLLLGQETGFHLLLFCLLPVGFLYKKWKITFFINSLIAFVLFLSVIWFETGQFKMYELSNTTLKFFRSVNTLGLITIVGVILFYYILLNNKLHKKVEETNKKLNLINNELNFTIEELNVQKNKIESQREILFEQNQNITASINYARRIQSALLPQKEILDEILPDHFILFLPKEIVSGDFYWASKVGHKIIFCAADCTGHGVPGAFMSLLGMAFLDDIVNRRKLLSTIEILDGLRIEIINALKQTGKREEQNDGMDIALCIYDQKVGQLEFAGAYNPLYLIHDGKMQELKADKLTISYFLEVPQSFNSTTVKVKEGDIAYIFSDGYADQMGGPIGARYRYGQLRDFINDIHSLPLSEQKILLEKNFFTWKGDLEQIDDVLLMGVKF